MLSMLKESVDEREGKLLEGAKKIESSELSNQKEADILDKADSLSAWAADKRTHDCVRSSPKVFLRQTWRLTIGELPILASGGFYGPKSRLSISAWWSSSMIPS